MKWIPKYQKAGKLNFKTTGLPWQQSKQDQETTRNAQFMGTLNPTNLKRRLQPAAGNLKAKYNNLSVRERAALAKQGMPHSEVVTVKDQQGNTKTSTNPQAGAMSGADPVGEFVVGTAAGNLGLGLGKMALSKMGQNAVSHWARNSLLNETAGNLTKNVSQGITNNLAAKEYTAGDNPIMQLSYYKPTRKAWSTGKAEGNKATSYFFKQQPNQRFELVKDIEPDNYSVHFKTDRNGLNYGNKMQLFAKVADEVPEGANLSTWGSVSKGGIHGVNRFGKDFGFIQNGTRQLTMKGTKEPVNIPIFQKPSFSFLNKANEFANTYGYPKFYMDKSDNLESQVKAMLQRHNTFARGVHIPDIEEQKQIKSIIGENATMDDMLQYASTHGRLEDPRKRIFISGSSNALAYSGFPNNGRTALVQREYKLGPDRNKWFDEADFKIYPQLESDNINTPHIRAPWAQGKSEVPETELSSENGKLLFKEWVQPEIRTVIDTEGNRHWWLQEQFPENKLSKNLKVR